MTTNARTLPTSLPTVADVAHVQKVEADYLHMASGARIQADLTADADDPSGLVSLFVQVGRIGAHTERASLDLTREQLAHALAVLAVLARKAERAGILPTLVED